MFKDTQLAGVLRRLRGGVEFGYLPEYLSAGGEQVATTLPLTDVPVLTPAGAVPPYFAGFLPEGRRLSSLRRAVKSSADDDLSLLLAVSIAIAAMRACSRDVGDGGREDPERRGNGREAWLRRSPADRGRNRGFAGGPGTEQPMRMPVSCTMLR